MHPDPLSKRLDGSTTIRCTLNLPRSADVRLHVPMTRNKEAGMHPSSYYDSSMTHHDDSSMTRKKEAVRTLPAPGWRAGYRWYSFYRRHSSLPLRTRHRHLQTLERPPCSCRRIQGCVQVFVRARNAFSVSRITKEQRGYIEHECNRCDAVRCRAVRCGAMARWRDMGGRA